MTGPSGSPTRAYVDRPVLDRTRAAAAAAVATDRWGLPPARPWRRGMNAIFVTDGVVIRVSTPNAPATASLALHEALAAAGLRVPRPMHLEPVITDGFTVSAWARVVESDAPVDWVEVGHMIAGLHRLGRERLPADHPVADPRTFPWWDFDVLLAEVEGALDEEAREGIVGAIERHAAWRAAVSEQPVVCHGDVHPGNVLNTPDGPVILDWDLLCRAPRGWDHGPLMTWHERWGGAPIYDDFAAGYGWSARGDGFAEAVAELRLVAATLMRVKAAMSDAGARAEADVRLRYWRGEPDAPAWTAQ